MFKKIKTDFRTAIFKLLRLILAITIWSCHVWVAPAFRLCRGSEAEPNPQEGGLKLKFLNPRPRLRNKFGIAERAETNSHVTLNPESGVPNLLRHPFRAGLFQHPVCFFSAFSKRGLNKSSTPPPLDPLNPSGFTLIELILVMVIIGILAATVLPRIDFGTTSSRVSVDGAAYMIASDIPNHIESHFNLEILLKQKGQWENAIESYQKVHAEGKKNKTQQSSPLEE